MKQICVVGTGYVGLVTGVLFADLGNAVTCIEIDPRKLSQLRRGQSPIYEPGLEELLVRNLAAGRLHFTEQYVEGVPDADYVFITVGTPMRADGTADLRYVDAAATAIGQTLHKPSIIIDKSTVPVGTGDRVATLIRQAAGARPFAVVSNPEFLREGSAVADFMTPDRIVLGSTDRAAAAQVAALYAPLDAPVMITDLRTAEMIKYASNAFLATRISFINEMAAICERLGADVTEVARGMGLDRRIGPHFLQAGVGYGGSCFPKDVCALHHMATAADCHPQLLQAVMDINRDARRAFLEKVADVLGDLMGATIGVLGLAFKPNTDDLREAPSVEIIEALIRAGATVQAYDPVAMDNAQQVLSRSVRYGATAYDVARDADALLVVTEWNEFKHLDLQYLKALMQQPIVIDGRNLYKPDVMAAHGFIYRGIGRGGAAAKDTSHRAVHPTVPA